MSTRSYSRAELVEASRERLKTHQRANVINDLIMLGQILEAATSIVVEAENAEPPNKIDRESVSFFEQESSRLYELYQRRIETGLENWNIQDINCTKSEYIETLVEGTMNVNQEEESDAMRIGAEVGRIGANTENVVVQYGVVINNHILYEVELGPFDNLTVEVEKLKKQNCENGEWKATDEYSGIEIHHPEQFTEAQQEVRKNLARAILVAWHDKEGKVICRGWHAPEQLEEISK